MPALPSSSQLHEVHLEYNVMIQTRDEVALATDLYFPAHNGAPLNGRYPALIHRTPYDKSQVERDVGFGHFFAQRGYVVIIQDCRGTFGSSGEVNFLVPEATDGFDTLEWIDQQSWSNGKVGSWGVSWAGWTQTSMAALNPGNLASMVPIMSGSSAYESSVRHGGTLELRFLAWAFWHSMGNTQANLKAAPHIDAGLNFGAPPFADWLTRLPIRKGQTQLKLVPPYERWALTLLTEADYTDYWKHPSYAPKLYWHDFPSAPILLVGGWYDSYTRGTCENYIGLTQAQETPVRLLMGPWVHGGNTIEQSHAGDIEFGSTAALDSFRDLHLDWFEWSLKAKTNELAQQSPVRIFVMGGGGGYRTSSGRLFHGGYWRDEAEWPLARTQYTPYYLHFDGNLSPHLPTAESAHTTYRFDPSNPVPSIGGNVSSLAELGPMPPGITNPALVPRSARINQIMEPGGFDQTEAPKFYGCHPPYLPLGSRPDILVFQTVPLEEPMELTGPIEVILWVSSSTPDTDFTAKLIDLYPPSPAYPHGYALNLTDSIMRLRYHNGFDQGKLLPPGTITQLNITLYPTSNLFASGHSIRLDLSSSNFPRFDVNPNTGDPIGCERRRQVTDNTIYHNAIQPSHIILPIIPIHSRIT